MKKLMNRALSIVLAVTMCVGLLSLSAFAAEDGKCPVCGKPTYTKGDFTGCTECQWSTTDKSQEPVKCEHEYGADDRCTKCKELNPSHKHAYDETGKCVCGAEHKTHTVTSWVPDWSNLDMHVGKCSVCGQEIKEEHTFGGAQWGRQSCTKCMYYIDVVPPETTHTHNYTYTYIEGDTKHTGICTNKEGLCTAQTIIEDCVFDQKGADPTRDYCVCGNSRSNVIDLNPGDKPLCPDGEHKFGNLYQHNDGYHWQQCMNCPYTTEHVQCDWKLMTVPGTNLASAYVCSVCGNTKPVNEGDIELCDPNNPKVSHNWVVNRTEKAEDGTMVVIVRCTNCGKEKIDGKCNSQEGFYTLTIHYQKPGGEQVFPDAVMSLAKDAPYSVGSPPLHGYDVEHDVVAGTMPGHDDVITVKYTPHEYKWTIYYVDEQGNTLHDPSVQTYTVETVKGLTAPANPSVPNYQVKEVSITPPDAQKLGDVNGKVVYEPITYTQTIVYVIDGADEPFATETREFNVNTWETLGSVESPVREGYTADKPSVGKPAKLESETVTVTYTLSAIYKLVVNHEYVALDGTRTVVTQTIGENYKVGDSYTTSAVARSGYSLSARPDNATGVFGAEDVTVTYVYNADRTPTPEPDPDPTPEPDPDPTPEPPVDINEPEVPLIEDPDVDIEEPEVPLAKEPEIELEEPDVPLADVPETGDKSLLWGCLTLISGAGLALLALMDKKRKDDEA